MNPEMGNKQTNKRKGKKQEGGDGTRKIKKGTTQTTLDRWLFKPTMGDKSVETLGSKIEFLSILVTFSPSPRNNVEFSICSTAQTTAPKQH